MPCTKSIPIHEVKIALKLDGFPLCCWARWCYGLVKKKVLLITPTSPGTWWSGHEGRANLTATPTVTSGDKTREATSPSWHWGGFKLLQRSEFVSFKRCTPKFCYVWLSREHVRSFTYFPDVSLHSAHRCLSLAYYCMSLGSRTQHILSASWL